MSEVFVGGESAITSLGFSLDEQIDNIKNNISGVKQITDRRLAPEDFFASLIDSKLIDSHFESLGNPKDFTRFEKL